MTTAKHVDTLAIFECDCNNDSSLVWVFPSMTLGARQVVLLCSHVGKETSVPFTYISFESKWHYILTFDGCPTSALPKITKFGISIASEEFNPEKYQHLLGLLSNLYATTGEPTEILQAVLRVNTIGKYSSKDSKDETKPWKAADFDKKKALLAGTSLKSVMGFFGDYSVLIWLAVLLKKRIFVLADKWSDVFFAVRSLPQLAWLRQDWSLLRPMVLLESKEQLEDLNKVGVYIAGTTDVSIRGRPQLYDVLVDMKTRKISVTDGAKASLSPPSSLADFAKEIKSLTSAKEASDHALIKAVAQKTKKMVALLRKASSDGKKISMEDIETTAGIKDRPTAVLLYNVALAEGLA